MLANGFILFGGGLHVRGVCHEPVWHSLDRILTGDSALWRLYPAITQSDIPFAQDFLGDQYLLRGEVVWQLHAEFGELFGLRCGLNEFLESAVRNPDTVLGLNLLRQFERDGGKLEPGELLSAYPPLCTEQARNGVSLRAVPATERLSFLADFARGISAVQDGESIRMNVVDLPMGNRKGESGKD